MQMNEYFLTFPFVSVEIRKFLAKCLQSKINFNQDEETFMNDPLVQLYACLQIDFREYPFINPSERVQILNYLSLDERIQLEQIEKFIQEKDKFNTESNQSAVIYTDDPNTMLEEL